MLQAQAGGGPTCRVAAQTFMRKREFGLTVSYCVSAEDWVGLGRIVDRMLAVYIAHGTYAPLP